MDRLPTFLVAVLVWQFVRTYGCGATEGQYNNRIQVKSSTRLDWTFAATRRSLIDPPADLVGKDYDSTAQSYEFYAPTHTTEIQQSLPLILYLSPQDQADGWHHWETFCRQNGYYFASPHNAGAEQPLTRRIRVVLDVLDDVRRSHRIDPDRTYLVGYGNGAHLACELGFSLPEYFGGILAINGGESPPVPLWMRRRIAERLHVAFLSVFPSVERATAAEFTEALFHKMAGAIGAESIHRQHYADNAKYPNSDLIRETILWLEQGVFRRRELATNYPSTRLDLAGPFSRESLAKQVLKDAEQRLTDETSVSAGIRELEGLQQRWPDLPVAAKAEIIRLSFEAREDRPWEAQERKTSSSTALIPRFALLHLHWKFKGIKSDVRIQDRSRGQRNYPEEYVEMKWNKPPIKLEEAAQDSTRFDRKTVALARRMGGMISFDSRGQVNKLNLGGTRVTAKQLRTLKEQLQGLEQLCALDLSSALLQDSALLEIADFRHLKALNLNHIGITNRGTSHIAGLNQLQYLGMAFTDVTNLKHLCNLPELRWLILGGCRVKDAELKHLIGLPNLQQLSLFACPISKAGVIHLAKLPNLNFLNVAATKLDDAACRHLADIPTLEELVLDDTRISDEGLKKLASLSNLRHLSLEGLRITDKGLKILSTIANLESINVVETQVTARSVASFKSTLPDCRVQWNGDPTNYRSQQRVQRANDLLLAHETEVRRFGLRKLQRDHLGVCLRSGEGLSNE